MLYLSRMYKDSKFCSQQLKRTQVFFLLSLLCHLYEVHQLNRFYRFSLFFVVWIRKLHEKCEGKKTHLENCQKRDSRENQCKYHVYISEM